MEIDCALLENILSNEALDNLLLTTTSERSLTSLLKIKNHRITEGTCEKMPFFIDSFYCTGSAELLKAALPVIANTDTILPKLAEINIAKLSSSETTELQEALNVLNVLTEHCKSRNESLTIPDICNVLAVLQQPSKSLQACLMYRFLPNYLDICSGESKQLVLNTFFEFVRESKRLEVLCTMYDKFVSNDFNLLANDKLWLLLAECILSKDNHLQKQAIYLLTRSVKTVFECQTNSVYVGDNEKSWHQYFILLDSSNEKQLHLIQPSLQLLSSTKNVPVLWRMCLYKLLLSHSQNMVVYSVALFILQNERRDDFFQIIPNFLGAINKHEYNAVSRGLFREMGSFCAKLDGNQLELFLQNGLKVPWTPVAFWCFLSNVFETCKNRRIPFNLIECLTKEVLLVPHTYIRGGCKSIILNYVAENFDLNASPDSVVNVLEFLWRHDDLLFKSVVKRCKEKHLFNEDLLNNFSESTTVPEDFDQTEFEDYMLKRVESLKEADDIAVLVSLFSKRTTLKIVQKASTILLDDTSKYNNAQKAFAFATVDEYRAVFNFWKKRFLDFSQPIDERVTAGFVDVLLKILANDSAEIEESVVILENVLDSQSAATTKILENISVILKFVDKVPLKFINRCLEEFLKLNKTGSFKTVANKFLAQLFHPEVEWFSEQLVEFCEKLLNISNNYNTIACILAEKIAHLSYHDSKRSVIFIPLIVELMLLGTVVTKNDRVEYFVCQDIGTRLRISGSNPNQDETAVRLWALDAMLHLVKTQPVADQFALLLIEKYMSHFAKRYFPDSHVHLQKLRIIQSLLLIHQHIKDKSKLIEVILGSFRQESHQSSVRHLLQWLLICLLGRDGAIQVVIAELKTVDGSRMATVSSFIPVLYHLTILQDEGCWDPVVDVLLPWTMGPQFKLRMFSQVALLKLYETAIERQCLRFTKKYEFLQHSLKQVVDSTKNTLQDDINREFLDYLTVENCDCATVYYKLPKINGVSSVEWQNLYAVYLQKQFKHLHFSQLAFSDNDNDVDLVEEFVRNEANIQKKITPWKETLASRNTNDFILVASLIEKPANLGGLCRTCEVFGIKQLVMRTSKITTDKEFASLSLSSENWVNIVEVKTEDLPEFIFGLKQKNYRVVGAEQTSESTKLDSFKFAKRTCLVLGNEKEGIRPDLIPLLDDCIEIPQFGMVRSLNVHVAGAVVIWEYCKQRAL